LDEASNKESVAVKQVVGTLLGPFCHRPLQNPPGSPQSGIALFYYSRIPSSASSSSNEHSRNNALYPGNHADWILMVASHTDWMLMAGNC